MSRDDKEGIRRERLNNPDNFIHDKKQAALLLRNLLATCARYGKAIPFKNAQEAVNHLDSVWDEIHTHPQAA